MNGEVVGSIRTEGHYQDLQRKLLGNIDGQPPKLYLHVGRFDRSTRGSTPLHAIAPLLLASQAPPELKEQRGEPGDRRHVIVDSLIGLRHLQHQLIRFLLKIRVVAAILHKLT